ncbi:thermonuclease family protein [Aureimonas sp. AU12]|uniref:thermonuclease family protein n=1 Tax=Aureimonas sp. AU12 TaxID=1638161 RepID=UPI000784763E|nr:thermonuclease family protein [Aureimonas sp. AU12]
MPTLRIALAFLAVLAAWIVFLPRQPTLLSPAPTATQEEIAPSAPNPPEATPPAASRSEPGRMERSAPVREVIPSPLAGGGDLVRMPPAASGAAVPIIADRAPTPTPGASNAPAEAGSATTPDASAPVATPDEATVAAIVPSEPQPDFRRFSQPIAVDSGTIQAGQTTLRVEGVEPIAPDARCSDGARSWPCGVRARTAFRAWLRGRSLLCSVPADAGDDVTVPCLLGEEDVGQWLVSNGWAAAAPGSRYADAQTQAKEARRGIWEFEIAN